MKALLLAAVVYLITAPTQEGEPYTVTVTIEPCESGNDPDGDHICNDGADNCTEVWNPSQHDSDEDGYGNVCDWDVSQDCVTGARDWLEILWRGLESEPWDVKEHGAYDINQDGVVGGPDLVIVQAHSLLPPGPSSRACADCRAAAATGVCR